MCLNRCDKMDEIQWNKKTLRSGLFSKILEYLIASFRNILRTCDFYIFAIVEVPLNKHLNYYMLTTM